MATYATLDAELKLVTQERNEQILLNNELLKVILDVRSQNNTLAVEIEQWKRAYQQIRAEGEDCRSKLDALRRQLNMIVSVSGPGG